MGAMAEAIAAYTQPLLDETDGSIDQMNDALALGQLCWNLALSPEKARDKILREMRASLNMSDDEFEEFRSSVIVSMIQRHQEMFPHMHRLGTTDPSDEPPCYRRPRPHRYALRSIRELVAMRLVPVTVGKNTSGVADDDHILLKNGLSVNPPHSALIPGRTKLTHCHQRKIYLHLNRFAS